MRPYKCGHILSNSLLIIWRCIIRATGSVVRWTTYKQTQNICCHWESRLRFLYKKHAERLTEAHDLPIMRLFRARTARSTAVPLKQLIRAVLGRSRLHRHSNWTCATTLADGWLPAVQADGRFYRPQPRPYMERSAFWTHCVCLSLFVHFFISFFYALIFPFHSSFFLSLFHSFKMFSPFLISLNLYCKETKQHAVRTHCIVKQTSLFLIALKILKDIISSVRLWNFEFSDRMIMEMEARSFLRRCSGISLNFPV